LAYAVALQLAEQVMEGAVRNRGEELTGQPRDQVQRYLEHLGTTGYPGSEEEFALIGEEPELEEGYRPEGEADGTEPLA